MRKGERKASSHNEKPLHTANCLRVRHWKCSSCRVALTPQKVLRQTFWNFAGGLGVLSPSSNTFFSIYSICLTGEKPEWGESIRTTPSKWEFPLLEQIRKHHDCLWSATYCSRPLLPTRCWFVRRWCVSTLEQRSWRRCLGGLKTGTPRRHRIQPVEGPVLDPRAKETCFEKGQKVETPWNQKWSPLEGLVLVPFLAPSLRQICWSVYFKLKLIWPATAAAGILKLGRPIFARLLFLTFWGPKTGPFFVLEALEACLEACPEVFCSNFHGLATLEFETCIEAWLQLCFIL